MIKNLYKSQEIYQQLMDSVAPLPCQQKFAQDLAQIMAIHINRCRLCDAGVPADQLPNPSALIVAQTGTGKTFLIRKMCEILGIGFVCIDASSLCREGWKGASLGQILLAAKESMSDDQFRKAIILIDEIDKLCIDRGQRGEAAPNLLQLFNNTRIHVERRNDPVAETIDPSQFCVLFAGAFEGLPEVVSRRLYPSSGIGLGVPAREKVPSKEDLLQQADTADLIAFGMMPELLGRISMILHIPAPRSEDYRCLLSMGPGTLPSKYQSYLQKLYGVTLSISEGAVETIVAQCLKQTTGIRGVTPIVQNRMMHALQAVESDDTIQSLTLTEQGVEFIHGKRMAPSLGGSATNGEAAFWTLRASSIRRLAGKLCSAYMRSNGKRWYLPELNAFLIVALFYLYNCEAREEFSIAGLGKLVSALKIIADQYISTFEKLIRSEINAHKPYSEELGNLFDKFCARRHVQSYQRIKTELYLITDRFVREHDTQNVLFSIEES